MAGPSLEQWISDLGLQQVNDPDVDKPVYRIPALDGPITLSAALEENICNSIREAAKGEISPGRNLHLCLVSAKRFTPATKQAFRA